MRVSVACVGLLAVLCLLLVVAALALGRFTPTQGILVYAVIAPTNATRDLFLLDVGSGYSLPLNHDPRDDDHVAWSPDGSQLLYASNRAGLSSFRLISIYDEPIQQISGSPGDVNMVAWSPDGRWIAYILYDGYFGYEVMVMDMVTGARQSLTRLSAVYDRLAWSPDGSALIFTMGTGSGSDLHLLRVADMQVTRLTEGASYNRSPVWGPDGRLAFVSTRDGNEEIYLLAQDGQTINLSNDPADDSLPAWSPVGHRIAYVSQSGRMRDIVLLDLDTGKKRHLTHDLALDYSPVWLADGQRLVFVSNRDGPYDLYLLDVDGGGMRRLTYNRNVRLDLSPAWQP